MAKADGARSYMTRTHRRACGTLALMALAIGNVGCCAQPGLVDVVSPAGGRQVVSPDRDLQLSGELKGFVAQLPEGHLASIGCVGFSPDGTRIVSGSDDGALMTRDASLSTVPSRLAPHKGFLAGCAYTTDGAIVSAGSDGARTLDSGGKIKASLPRPGDDAITSMFVRDACVTLFGWARGKVTEWNACVGKVGKEFDYSVGGPPSIATVGYLDGRPFAAGSEGIVIWSDPGVTRLKGRFSGGAIGPDGRAHLIDEKGVWALEGGSPPRLVPEQKAVPRALAAGPNGALLTAEVGGGVTLRVQGKPVCRFAESEYITAVAWNPQGTRLAAGSSTGAMYVGTPDECRSGQLHVQQSNRVNVMAIAVEDQIVLGDAAGGVSRWDPATLHATGADRVGHGAIQLVAAAPGTWVASASDGSILVSDGDGVRTIVNSGNPSSMVLTPPSRLRFSRGESIYEVDTRAPRLKLLTSVRAPNGLGLVADGSSAISLLASGQPQQVLFDGSEPTPITRLDFASGDTWFALRGGITARATQDGSVQVLQGSSVRTFTGANGRLELLEAAGAHLWGATADGHLYRWTLSSSNATPDATFDEGVRLLTLAGSADGSVLLSARSDATVEVRDGNGSVLAHLFVFRDGSTLSVRADGSLSGTGAPELTYADRVTQVHRTHPLSLEQLFTNPVTHQDRRPRDVTGVSVSSLAQTSMPDGTVLLEATVVSPRGLPKITIDNEIPVDLTRRPSNTSHDYEVTLQLGLEPGQHTLDADDGEWVYHKGFSIVPAPWVQNGRALLIGNHTYAHRHTLAGVSNDIRALNEFLTTDPLGWKLLPDRVVHVDNADHAALTTNLKKFFDGVAPDERLLVYFGGHGEKGPALESGPASAHPGTPARGKSGTQRAVASAERSPSSEPPAVEESYILPVEVGEHGTQGGVSIREIWTMAKQSKAAQVLIVIDACSAGAFSPGVLSGTHSGPRVAIIAASTDSAQEHSSGGLFTQSLLKALHSSENVDERAQAVTVGGAFFAAGRAMLGEQQAPIWQGDNELMQLPLARPTPVRTLLTGQDVPTTGGKSGIRLASAEMLTTNRGVGIGSGVGMFSPPSSPQGYVNVDLLLTFDAPTEAFRAVAYQPDNQQPVYQRPVNRQGAWREGAEQRVSLSGLNPNSPLLIELQTCARNYKSCGPVFTKQLQVHQ